MLWYILDIEICMYLNNMFCNCKYYWPVNFGTWSYLCFYLVPCCYPTVGKKGQYVLTDGHDAEAISRGVYNTYTRRNLRYSQVLYFVLSLYHFFCFPKPPTFSVNPNPARSPYFLISEKCIGFPPVLAIWDSFWCASQINLMLN